MKYRLINKTKIPREKIHEFIKFCCPKGVNGFSISMLNADDYTALDGITFTAKNKIKIWVGFNKLPRMSNEKTLKKVGYTPIYLIKNEDELILSVISHELRHLWQMNVSGKNFVNGKVCKYIDWGNKKRTTVYKMESDACRYAKKMLNKYRRITKLC